MPVFVSLRAVVNVIYGDGQQKATGGSDVLLLRCLGGISQM